MCDSTDANPNARSADIWAYRHKDLAVDIVHGNTGNNHNVGMIDIWQSR